MKFLITLFFLFGTPGLFSQIPNAGFENWSFNGWNYIPDQWETDNSQLQEPVSQDLEPFQGDFAMKVTAVPYPFGKLGEARVSFPNEVVPTSLDFWVKSSVENGYVEVRIEFWNEDLLVYTEQWINVDAIEEWTFVSIELDQIEPLLTDATIQVTALVGDLVNGDAEISLDAMSFGQPQSVNNSSQYKFSIYPNPVQNHFTFQDEEGQVEFFEIYSLEGKLIQTVQVVNRGNQSVDISSLANGIYSLLLRQGKNILGTQKLVVSR